jgi:hypothetical protein
LDTAQDNQKPDSVSSYTSDGGNLSHFVLQKKLWFFSDWYYLHSVCTHFLSFKTSDFLRAKIEDRRSRAKLSFDWKK